MARGGKGPGLEGRRAGWLEGWRGRGESRTQKQTVNVKVDVLENCGCPVVDVQSTRLLASRVVPSALWPACRWMGGGLKAGKRAGEPGEAVHPQKLGADGDHF